MRGYDQNASILAYAHPDPAQPALDLVLFLAFARFPHHEIKGAAAKEEKLMSDPVYFLTAEGVRLSQRCLIQGCFGQAARLRRSIVSSS